MNAFRVWLRPLGYICRVRVDGIKSTEWLLRRLSQSFVFKTSEPLSTDETSSCCSFSVMYSAEITRRKFERLLGTIPEVNLLSEPA